MPTISMGAEDKDYAVSFAVPDGHRGHVHDHTAARAATPASWRRTRTSTWATRSSAAQEALVVFDHVFIPNEYIFLNGEY